MCHRFVLPRLTKNVGMALNHRLLYMWMDHFWPDEKLPPKQRQQKLCHQIQQCMQDRAQQYNNYEYVHYQKK